MPNREPKESSSEMLWSMPLGAGGRLTVRLDARFPLDPDEADILNRTLALIVETIRSLPAKHAASSPHPERPSDE